MDEIQSHPFIRILLKRALHFLFFADTKKEYDEIMDNLHQITEKTFWIKPPESFLSMDIILSASLHRKSFLDYEEVFYAVEIKINIIAENPFWIKKSEYYFYASESLSTDNKKYAYRYAYRYANGMRNRSIMNSYIKSM